MEEHIPETKKQMFGNSSVSNNGKSVIDPQLLTLNDRYRLLLENSNDLIAELNALPQFIYVNRSFKTLLGYNPEELINTNPFSIVHPDDEARLNNMLQGVFKNKNQFSAEFRAKTKNDGWKWLESIGNLFKTSDGEYHLITIARDISERKSLKINLKDSESTTRALLNATTDLLLLIDINYTVLMLNQPMAESMGYKANEIINKNLFQFINTSTHASRKARFEEVLNTGKPLRFEDMDNGKYFDNIFTPVFDEEKHVSKIAVFAHDITLQKQAEEKFKRQTLELEQLSANKDKFFSIVMHDLKSPFNGLLGFCDVLNEDFDFLTKEEIRLYINHIRSGTKNVYSLIENLLAWSRLQTGKVEFEPEPLDIAEEVDNIFSLLSGNAFRKNINFEHQIPAKTLVFCDHNMLHSILQNLISNALKFTNIGGQIVVSSQTMPGFVVISIADSGVGMSKEIIGKLFRIDKQYSTPGTNNEQGTGLGLVLCKELIEKNGGQISVESKIGVGSRFIFTLPKA